MPARNVPEVGLLNADKWVHVLMYFVMAFLLMRSKWFVGSNYTILVAFVSVGFGVIVEWMQEHWTADRHFDYLDVVANALGVIVFLFTKRFVKSG